MTKKLPGTALGRKRLLQLADLLEKDAANKKGIKFDLEVLLAPANKKDGDGFGYFKEEVVPTLDCKTAACAMGLAALSGEFEGLSLELLNTVFIDYDVTYDDKTHKFYGFVDSAKALFGIPYEDVTYLFIAESYPTPMKGAKGERAVAKRIRDYVAGKAIPSQFDYK